MEPQQHLLYGSGTTVVPPPRTPAGKEKGRRFAVLIDSSLDHFRNKTGVAVIRFCPDDVICAVDPRHAGMDCGQALGVGAGIPVVAGTQEAIALGATALVIGVATPGGVLPGELRSIVHDAIRHRMSVVSGLHQSIGRDPNLASLAARHAVEIVNLRRVADADERTIGTAQARKLKCLRVLTVGTDANSGKTTVSGLLHQRLGAAGVRSRFAATGQDGILISGSGTCIDRCIADFASGAVERLVLREGAEADVLVVEGQDSILSPCYGAVSLSVLHGSCPDAMVLCHVPLRTVHRHTDVPIPSLAAYRDLYEAMLAPLHPGKVVAICLNTMGMDGSAARDAVERAAEDTGLPAVDLVREGAPAMDRLIAAIADHGASVGKRIAPTRPRAKRRARR